MRDTSTAHLLGHEAPPKATSKRITRSEIFKKVDTHEPRIHDVASELSANVMEALDRDDGPGGLVSEIVAIAPHLVRRVAELCEKHQQLRLLAVTVYRYARTHAPQAMMHVLVSQLQHALTQTHRLQAEVLQEAWLIDLGESG